MALLPSFIVLRSVSFNAYVSYDAEKGGEVQAREEHIFSPYAKIEVERAKIDDRFVHLRFSHSFKYWSIGGDGNWYIVATSNQPEEDRSRWSCTMFEPSISDGRLDFRHVYSGNLVGTIANDANRRLLVIPSPSNLQSGAFTFLDWNTLVIMPKHVTFKGDNDKYLRSTWNGYHEYLQFASDDGNEVATAYEVTMNPDGHIRIKSKHFDKFWRLSPSWIWADSTDTDGSNNDTLFWPIKMNGNTIALRNAGNGRFCKRLTADGKTNCLNAGVPTITAEAKLQVEELVLDRDIYDVEYLMDDARIFNERPVVAGTGTARNDTPEEGNFSVTVSYEDTSSYSFSNSLSIMLGAKTSITSGLPYIVDGEIEMSAEVTNSFEWNRTTTVTRKAEAKYEAVVPSMSEITVNYVATQGTCSIPFKYTQRDKLSGDGSIVYARNNDGVYKDVNNYGFHFKQVATRSISI